MHFFHRPVLRLEFFFELLVSSVEEFGAESLVAFLDLVCDTLIALGGVEAGAFLLVLVFTSLRIILDIDRTL